MDRVEATDRRCMARALRRWVIEQSLDSNVGHIGCALSVVDIITALWGGILRHPGTGREDRDRFILSKGHAALALFAALRWLNRIEAATFATYCKDGSLLGVHPEHTLAGVDASTGSLGHGLSIGCGMAFGLRLKEIPARVYVLVSDAECNEGQVWETAMFAAHHRLANLCAVVDLNGQQALAPTRDVLHVPQLGNIWRSLGWDVAEVDGHDDRQLTDTLTPRPEQERPRLVLARTVLGKGVSFMERRVEWHYQNLTRQQAEQALAELEALP